MNGKPQLIYGQGQLMGPNELQRRGRYTKPALSPVGNGNSFASMLSSAIEPSGTASGAFAIEGETAGKAHTPTAAHGDQNAALPGVSTMNLLDGQTGRISLPGKNIARTRPSGTSKSRALENMPGTQMGMTPGSAPLAQGKVSTLPKNYSFGMEDTRPRHSARSGKHAIQVGTGSSARAINESASRSAAVNAPKQASVETFITGNGALGETPYRGLLLSREDTGRNALGIMKGGPVNKKEFTSPLLSGGSTQLLMQLVKEVGYAVGTVGGILQLKDTPVLHPAGSSAVQAAADARSVKNAERKPATAYGARAVTRETGISKAVNVVAATIDSIQRGFDLGALSAKFESGESGIGAIGYDRHGGTSYGKYQISSRMGSFAGFMEYLEMQAPDIAEKLRAGGAANTGSRYGKMPNVWRSIAEAEPERFEQLQTDFIMSSHYQPAVSAIAEATGVAFGSMPEALREVVFSTAVQHGVAGAAKIISRAVASVGAEKLTADEEAFLERTGQDLIKQIYTLRARQFSSSTSMVRHAVQNRLREEMNDALTLLQTASEGQKHPIAYDFKA